ncbi:hypothetical protein K458DRAFT_39748 [Lentithecium fluviatile CBS 122367]|uniref:Uncharacterized protein n=1 Tax=Lentithecium fluviatile CBS 122367 TaxID=1168545 RepID=A0A6G1IZB2_9PLEO|nr:hypothetical protein K458DRAFT_39748 [Lentithecium fluviatile CBS 122367]
MGLHGEEPHKVAVGLKVQLCLCPHLYTNPNPSTSHQAKQLANSDSHERHAPTSSRQVTLKVDGSIRYRHFISTAIFLILYVLILILFCPLSKSKDWFSSLQQGQRYIFLPPLHLTPTMSFSPEPGVFGDAIGASDTATSGTSPFEMVSFTNGLNKTKAPYDAISPDDVKRTFAASAMASVARRAFSRRLPTSAGPRRHC